MSGVENSAIKIFNDRLGTVATSSESQYQRDIVLVTIE